MKISQRLTISIALIYKRTVGSDKNLCLRNSPTKASAEKFEPGLEPPRFAEIHGTHLEKGLSFSKYWGVEGNGAHFYPILLEQPRVPPKAATVFSSAK